MNLASPPDGQDPRWTVVQRIVESPLFSKSVRLKSLLLYITRKAIEGRLEAVTESQIGVNVFGRSAGYNPAEDNIVRSHARLLRKKLELYFEEAGAHETLLITIPKGAYVPFFEVRACAAVPAPEEPKTQHDGAIAPPNRNRSRLLLVSTVATAALLAGLLLLSFLSLKNSPRARHSDRPWSHSLWSRIFQPGRNTVLVPADSGLVMFENFARRPVHLAEYLSHQYVFDPLPASSALDAAAVRGLGARRYTSFVDLNLGAALVRLPEVVPARFRIRYARDLSIVDFKESNVILSGAVESNPWLELLENRLFFKIENDQARAVYTITDACPAIGGQAAYTYDPHSPAQSAYAVVAFLPGRASAPDALVIEGTTAAGTEGAADFVLDEKTIGPIVQRAALADGSIGAFQVLLETRNIAGSAPAVSIFAAHFGSGKCNSNVIESQLSESR